MPSKFYSTILFPINAALSFATVVLLSASLPIAEFALIAFAIGVGSYFAIVVNFGQDQTQILGLLQRDSVLARRYYFANRQIRSIAVLFVIVFGYCFIEAMLGVTVDRTLISGASLFWAALIGLYPNAYVDFLGRLSLQQAIILLERVLSAVFVMSSISLFRELSALDVLFVLIALRVVAVGVQFTVCILLDDREERDQVSKVADSLRTTDGSIKVAAAQLINSLGVYGSLIVFRGHASADDLAVVSFCILCFSFATMLPATYIRKNLKEFARADAHGSDEGNALIISQARSLTYVALATASISISLIWAWLLLVVKQESDINHFLSGLVVGVWAIGLTYGMRLTRAIIHKRQVDFYLIWSIAYFCMAFPISVWLGAKYGALGFFVAVVVPHLLVIFRYHLFIVRSHALNQ